MDAFKPSFLLASNRTVIQSLRTTYVYAMFEPLYTIAVTLYLTEIITIIV